MKKTALQKKQLVFLEETCSHYNSGNRSATSSNGCKYYPTNPNTQGCAIGRHITKKLCKELDTMVNPGVINDKIFELLPKKLKNLTQEFLSRVQGLHDNKYNWTETGLSEKGLINKEYIIDNFNL